jgi:hypothetical protein
MEISPAATEEEAAAIAVAIDALWPRPIGPGGPAERPSVWKFSGRWWSQPIPLRRARPWV